MKIDPLLRMLGRAQLGTVSPDISPGGGGAGEPPTTLIAGDRSPHMAVDMKILIQVVGGCVAVLSLLLLATAQLIWARSELSYYLQLGLAVLLVATVYASARRTSWPWLVTVALATGSAVGLMPLDSTFSSYGALFSGGAASLGGAAIGQHLRALGVLCGIHFALHLVFGATVRARHVRGIAEINRKRG